MSNSVFKAFGGNNIFEQIKQFRKQMEGINPNEEISRLLRSGRINQDQLNQAQQMAQQFDGMFRQ